MIEDSIELILLKNLKISFTVIYCLKAHGWLISSCSFGVNFLPPKKSNLLIYDRPAVEAGFVDILFKNKSYTIQDLVKKNFY